MNLSTEPSISLDTGQLEIARVWKFIKELNPTLSPAINRTWIDSWGRAGVVAIYRVDPIEMSGRTTDGVSSQQGIAA